MSSTSAALGIPISSLRILTICSIAQHCITTLSTQRFNQGPLNCGLEARRRLASTESAVLCASGTTADGGPGKHEPSVPPLCEPALEILERCAFPHRLRKVLSIGIKLAIIPLEEDRVGETFLVYIERNQTERDPTSSDADGMRVVSDFGKVVIPSFRPYH